MLDAILKYLINESLARGFGINCSKQNWRSESEAILKIIVCQSMRKWNSKVKHDCGLGDFPRELKMRLKIYLKRINCSPNLVISFIPVIKVAFVSYAFAHSRFVCVCLNSVWATLKWFQFSKVSGNLISVDKNPTGELVNCKSWTPQFQFDCRTNMDIACITFMTFMTLWDYGFASNCEKCWRPA